MKKNFALSYLDICAWRNRLMESDLSYKAKLVGFILSQYFRIDHPTYPSIRTLAQNTSLTINPVQDGLKELIENNYITRDQIRQTGNRFLSNIYQFVILHVSLDDTSYDTSNDTSYDTSSHDTEVKVNIGKKEKDKKEELNLPTWINKTTWNDYLEVRRKLKAVNSLRALEAILKKLEIMKEKGVNINEVIESSIINSWKGVFEPKVFSNNLDNNQEFNYEGCKTEEEHFNKTKEYEQYKNYWLRIKKKPLDANVIVRIWGDERIPINRLALRGEDIEEVKKRCNIGG